MIVLTMKDEKRLVVIEKTCHQDNSFLAFTRAVRMPFLASQIFL
jgi:hypothetical protein